MRETVFYNIKCDYNRWRCHSAVVPLAVSALNYLKTKTLIKAAPTLR